MLKNNEKLHRVMGAQDVPSIVKEAGDITNYCIAFCGVILHSLLLFAFVKDPLKCFKNFRMSFVINLEVSDFLVCFVTSLVPFVNDDRMLFLIFQFLGESSSNVTYLTITSISIDRALMVIFPMKHRVWVTRKVIIVWLSGTWLVSLFFATRRFVFKTEQSYESAVYHGLVVALCLLSSIAYARVYIALKKQSRNMAERNDTQEDRAQKLRLLKEKKFLKTIILIACITFVSFVPIWPLKYVIRHKVLSADSFALAIPQAICHMFFYFNYAVNPLIYVLRFPNYRKSCEILYCRRLRLLIKVTEH